MSESFEDILKTLREIQSQSELTIIKLCEPFNELLQDSPEHKISSEHTTTRTLDNPTPATLAADLAHYKVSLPIAILSLMLTF